MTPPHGDQPISARRHLLLAALAWPAAAARAQARAPGEVLIGGTGAGMAPLQQAVGQHKGLRWVPNLSTSGGLKALQAGAIDIALAGRSLTEPERAQGLVDQPLFRTPYVFAVHGDVPVRAVTLDQLAALYAGRTNQWPDGQPVRLVLRPASDGDTSFVKSLGPGLAEAVGLAHARPGNPVAMVDAEAIEALDRIGGSLGVTTLGLVRAERRRLHVLDLDGVRPEADALIAKRYPHSKTVYLVSRGKRRPEEIAVIALFSEAAVAQALHKLACVPAPARPA